MCTVSIMVTPAAYLLSCTGTPPGPVTCVPSAHFLLQQLHCLPIYHTPGIILLCGNLCTRTPSWVSFLLLKSYPFLTLNHYAVPQTFVKMIFLCLRLAHGAGLGVCSAGGRGRDAWSSWPQSSRVWWQWLGLLATQGCGDSNGLAAAAELLSALWDPLFPLNLWWHIVYFSFQFYWFFFVYFEALCLEAMTLMIHNH